jgi:phosphoglycerol transferase MdoB-like AlkP superfamily enzyme
MHSNNGHFFSRAFAYDKLPVDLFIDAKGFQENASGWYAKDEAFFMQALDHLAPPVQQPLCAYLITMQSHSPFRNHNIPHAFTLDFRGDGRYSTLEQHYLQAMHDVDSALASFLTALPERLETTNNLVVIFGDHSSGVLNRPAGKREPITLLFHHPDLEARKLRQPVSHLDVAPTISHLLGLPRGATWLGDDILAQGTRRVVLPNGAIVTWGPDSGTVHVLPGAGMPYVEYSTSLLQGGTP